MFEIYFQMISLCLQYICYDPNYNYDEDDDEETMEMEDEEEEGWVSLCMAYRLHQASASTRRELGDDASDTVLIENNGAARKWVATPIESDSIGFNENSVFWCHSPIRARDSNINSPGQKFTWLDI